MTRVEANTGNCCSNESTSSRVQTGEACPPPLTPAKVRTDKGASCFGVKWKQLWNRAFSSIRKINNKTPDSDGAITLEATDILTAGSGIIIANNVISTTGVASAAWGSINGNIDSQTDLKDKLDNIGDRIDSIEDEIGNVGESGTIRDDINENATDIEALEDEIGAVGQSGTIRNDIALLQSGKQDVLTAGTGISIVNNIISNTQQSAVWGNISGTITSQTDLVALINAARPLIWRSGQ